jgi:hypothetical protein
MTMGWQRGVGLPPLDNPSRRRIIEAVAPQRLSEDGPLSLRESLALED